jgi:hypothetical protein
MNDHWCQYEKHEIEGKLFPKHLGKYPSMKLNLNQNFVINEYISLSWNISYQSNLPQNYSTCFDFQFFAHALSICIK